MAKLKYYLKDKKKIYTLKEKIPNSDEKTKDAHYKFIHLRDEDEIHPKFERR